MDLMNTKEFKDVVGYVTEYCERVITESGKPRDPEFISNLLDGVYRAALYNVCQIPTVPIEDLEEKWVPLDLPQMIGKEIKVSKDMSVTVESVERHADIPEGSIGMVIRLNHDSDLAAMMFGSNYAFFDKVGDMEPSRVITLLTFIKEFPFQVRYPVMNEVYRNAKVAIISDIPKIGCALVPDDDHRAYSPNGTMIYPKAIPSYAHPYVMPKNEGEPNA